MQPSTAAPDHRTAAAFVDRIVAELEPLYHDHNEAVWRANITGDPAHEGESARLDAEIRKIFARQEPFRFLSDTLKAGGVADAVLQRQLVLLHHSFQAHQIPPWAGRYCTVHPSCVQRASKARSCWLESRKTRTRVPAAGTIAKRLVSSASTSARVSRTGPAGPAAGSGFR